MGGWLNRRGAGLGEYRRAILTSVLGCVLSIALPPANALAQGPALSVASDPGLVHLEREIARIADLSAGKVGVAAVHLETGRAIYHNLGEPFPMASSYKVPIAVQLLTRVDRGELRLDSLVMVRPTDLHPGSGTLTQLFRRPGVALSVHNLLELMLLISDNSATDILLNLSGGGGAVNARLRALGVEGIRVDRPTSLLIGDFIGIPGLPPDGEISPEDFQALSRAVTATERRAAAEAFDRDPRDTSTPEGMARLLDKIWRGEALSPASTEILLDIMRRSTTGMERIKGMLPPATEVAHKTGTIGGTTNDVGIITLPNGAGHVITVVYVKESPGQTRESERVIAHISRAIHDYFIFNPGAMPASD